MRNLYYSVSVVYAFFVPSTYVVVFVETLCCSGFSLINHAPVLYIRTVNCNAVNTLNLLKVMYVVFNFFVWHVNCSIVVINIVKEEHQQVLYIL
jgi:hypothetical protein